MNALETILYRLKLVKQSVFYLGLSQNNIKYTVLTPSPPPSRAINKGGNVQFYLYIDRVDRVAHTICTGGLPCEILDFYHLVGHLDFPERAYENILYSYCDITCICVLIIGQDLGF